MLVKIIFQDGSTASIKDAARMILNYERVGLQSGLKALYQDEKGSQFETFVFWRTVGKTFHFMSTSGTSLANVRI